MQISSAVAAVYDRRNPGMRNAPAVTDRRYRMAVCVVAIACSLSVPGHAQEDESEAPPAELETKAKLTLQPLIEPMPEKPRNIGFVDEVNPTPDGQPNPSADALNRFLKQCMNNALEKSTVKKRWQDFPGFLDWAVWGYLSADSDFKGDPRLVEMIQEWFDHQFVVMNTPPEDPAKAAKWGPDKLGQWRFEIWSIPMLEIEIRPDLQEKIGRERVDRFRAILLKNVEATFGEENLQALLNRIIGTINFAAHPIASPLHGWVLTGKPTYWQLAENTITGLDKFLLPDGMFAYQKFGENRDIHTTETPYYHAINIAALYMYWWATGSERAKGMFERSVPYYPLNFEPPTYYNGGTDIWWKDQWRPFWAAPVAMVAAVTGDGQNAKLANEMARRRVETDDAYYLTLGAHAYLQMGLKGVKEKPFENNFIRESADIRGVRSRWGNWSTTFTGAPYNYTRASAMLVDPEARSGLSALHMARPLDRVSQMNKAVAVERDFGTASLPGTEFSLAKTDRIAVFAATYRLTKANYVWREGEAESKWLNHELWISTPEGLLGLMESTLTERQRAFEFSHQFKFITPNKEDGIARQPGLFEAGQLRFRIWETSFPHTITERVRRYFQGPKDRNDWQVVLSDSERSPEQVIQLAKTPEEKKAAQHPADKLYEPGVAQFSLVEVSPLPLGGWDAVARADGNGLLGLRARKGEAEWLAIYNPDEAEKTFTSPPRADLAAASWPEAKLEGGKLALPSKGVALFSIGGEGTE